MIKPARILPFLLLIPLIISCKERRKPSSGFSSLLVEYSECPINIDKSHPRFSWIFTSSERNQVQTACRILVASSDESLAKNKADLWDSGMMAEKETIQHAYLPDNLKSDSHYFWKVIIRDGDGRTFESKVSEFSTAFLQGDKWSASWIGSEPEHENMPACGFYRNIQEQARGKAPVAHDGRSLLLRYETSLTKKVASARAFVTGVGYYEFYINGSRVGENVLSPAKTPYHKYILYDTYDVTALVKEGKNAFGLHLGNGWYNPYKKWWNEYRMQWFGHKKAIMELHLKYSDGSSEIISSNEKWLCSPGPLLYNCVYDGEFYDANLDQKGWCEPGFDDSAWNKVVVYGNMSSQLVSERMPGIKVHETFSPREIGSSRNGSHLYDMGQNFAGWVRITAKGASGARLKIRFVEDIRQDSTPDFTSNENARATAEYIMKGGPNETYEPRFTFFGFRYAEISVTGSAEILEIQGRAVYSGNPQTGQFECGNDLVNRIHRATVWSQKSNMLGYPMDCPQRDERLGWMGDAQVTADEALCNFNMALFYDNWLDGIMANQDAKTGDIPIISPRPYIHDDGVEWSSTYLTMAWQYYLYYGDRELLARHYRAMKGYMQFLGKLAKDKILPKGWIGDWGSIAEGWQEGEPRSVPTAYYFLDAEIMSDIAAVLKIPEDRVGFKQLATAIKEKYNSTFLDTLAASYNDGSQMANSFPLYLGIIPDKYRSKVIDNLIYDIEEKHRYHLTTGVLGTKYMPEALVSAGRGDIAWKLINQKTAPCWYDMISRYTTMCEFWTLKQSKNHVMMGSIDAWFYRHLAGIQPVMEGPAFSEFKIKPVIPDSLQWARAAVETLRGKIVSGWEKDNGILTFRAEIPFNTFAEIWIPGKEEDKLTESGIAISRSIGADYLGYRENCHVVKVGSGTYIFKSGI